MVTTWEYFFTRVVSWCMVAWNVPSGGTEGLAWEKRVESGGDRRKFLAAGVAGGQKST